MMDLGIQRNRLLWEENHKFWSYLYSKDNQITKEMMIKYKHFIPTMAFKYALSYSLFYSLITLSRFEHTKIHSILHYSLHLPFHHHLLVQNLGSWKSEGLDSLSSILLPSLGKKRKVSSPIQLALLNFCPHCAVLIGHWISGNVAATISGVSPWDVMSDHLLGSSSLVTS